MKHRVTLILFIVAVQVVAIAALGMYIYGKQGARFVTSVDILRRENFSFSQTETLKHFMEPVATPGGRVETPEPPSWLTSKPRYTINSEGMNNPVDYPVQKPPRTFRIVTLGDSWTFGYLVNTEDNYPSQIEKLLNTSPTCKGTHFEVLNFGVPGYDLAYGVERFKTRAAKYDPDLVLWFVRDNNFAEPNEFFEERVPQAKKEMQERGDTPNVVLRSGNGGIEYVESTSGKSFFDNPEQGIGLIARKRTKEAFLSEWGIDGMIEYGRRQLAALGEAYGGPLVVFTYPLMGETELLHARIKTTLVDFAAERKAASYHEIAEDLSVGNGLLPDFHPNEKGYALIAQDLFDELVSRGLIPCGAP